MPLRFIPNKGQAGTEAKYHVQGVGHTVLFQEEKIGINTFKRAIEYFYPTNPTYARADKVNIYNYSLSQNFPNQFNPSTSIKYTIPNQNYVSLKVFDGLRREVAELVNKKQSQGNYKVEFDASSLTSGVYFYRVTAGDFAQTKKMLLLK